MKIFSLVAVAISFLLANIAIAANVDLKPCGAELVKFKAPKCMAAKRDGGLISRTSQGVKAVFVTGNCGFEGKTNYEEVYAKGKRDANGNFEVMVNGEFICTNGKLQHQAKQ